MHKRHSKKQGFTIVELLIVIVVIAILAAISIVAFTGIQDRAAASKAKSDLRNIHQKLSLYHAEYERYPDSVGRIKASGIAEVVQGASNSYALYCGNATGYEVVARTSSRQTFKIGSDLALNETIPSIGWSGWSGICAETAFPVPPNFQAWSGFW